MSTRNMHESYVIREEPIAFAPREVRADYAHVGRNNRKRNNKSVHNLHTTNVKHYIIMSAFAVL